MEIIGNKGSRMLLLSVIVSTFLALIPVFTGDTISSDCEEGVCVEGGDITYLYIIAAFIKYPWMLMLYWETGLWLTGSGLSVKCAIMRDDILSSIDCYSIPSIFEPLRCIVRYIASLEQLLYWGVEFLVIVLGFMSFCSCEEMSYLTYLSLFYLFIPPVRMFGFIVLVLITKTKGLKFSLGLTVFKIYFSISLYTLGHMEL